MRPFVRHDREEPIEPGRPYELRIVLLPMSVLVRAVERLRLEIGNWESTWMFTRDRWLRFHLARTVVGLMSFAIAAIGLTSL
jgi:predicted acyl esterase